MNILGALLIVSVVSNGVQTVEILPFQSDASCAVARLAISHEADRITDPGKIIPLPKVKCIPALVPKGDGEVLLVISRGSDMDGRGFFRVQGFRLQGPKACHDARDAIAAFEPRPVEIMLPVTVCVPDRNARR